MTKYGCVLGRSDQQKVNKLTYVRNRNQNFASIYNDTRKERQIIQFWNDMRLVYCTVCTIKVCYMNDEVNWHLQTLLTRMNEMTYVMNVD